jgi:DNA-binding IclR family transcriptional regulator
MRRPRELAEHLGLTKSTTHHHLAQLRAARLVVLRGNAGGYSYALADEGLGEAVRALADLAPSPERRPRVP